MSPIGTSASAPARKLDVPANRVTSILNGDRRVMADTAPRPGHHFGTPPEFRINPQSNHDLSKARTEAGSRITGTVRRRAPVPEP